MLLGGARHWLFLGQLCAAIPTLVLWKGADALSICLNAVALLFLAEIDNALYHFGLSASVRVRVERAARLELTEEQSNSINRSSQAHLLLVVLVVLGTVQFGGKMPAGYWTGVLAFPPRIAFLVGGLYTCVVAGVTGTRSPKKVAQETASVIAKCTVGLAAGFFLCF